MVTPGQTREKKRVLSAVDRHPFYKGCVLVTKFDQADITFDQADMSEQQAHFVGNHEVASPGGGDGRGVLPSKKRCDEQARDLVVCQRPPAIHLHRGKSQVAERAWTLGGVLAPVHMTRWCQAKWSCEPLCCNPAKRIAGKLLEELVACASQTPCTNASRFITASPKMISLGPTLQAK